MTHTNKDLIERVARLFHENYERLAPQFSYETRKASAVPWEQVPENNRKLMCATVAATLSALPPSTIWEDIATELAEALQSFASEVATTAMPEAACERIFPFAMKANAALAKYWANLPEPPEQRLRSDGAQEPSNGE